MKNKKGFTLIELLAVIIILGILMIIAIPSVTQYINNSRKSAYVDTAKEIIAGARNLVNQGNIEMFDTDTTYYIDAECIGTENGLKSPYGEFSKAYVVVTFDGKGYEYFWTSVDDAGQGIKKITKLENLDIDKIDSDLKNDDIPNSLGIDKRNKYMIIDKEQTSCGKGVSLNVSGRINGETGDEFYPVCKRAQEGTLHTETCNRTSNGCYDAGYYPEGSKGTSTITYGNLGTNGILPSSGDAFDCDVNNDGVYDAATERFYYIKSDNNTSILIYYKSSGSVAYATTSDCEAIDTCGYSGGCNWFGPVTAYTKLPSKSEWSNPGLISPGSRTILTESGGSTTSGGTIHSFTYSDRAARLMTYDEVIEVCGSGTINDNGYLDNCNYLLENVGYYITTHGSYGYWLETPHSGNSVHAWNIYGYNRYLTSGYEVGSAGRATRPVITVLTSDIDY